MSRHRLPRLERDVESLNVLQSLQHDLAQQDIELWLGNVHDGVRAVLGRDNSATTQGLRVFRRLEDAAPLLVAFGRDSQQRPP